MNLSNALLDWYLTHRRALPWREKRDAYSIWISEIMLQQTQVETVIPYYHRFMERYPDVNALAEAPLEEVLKSWEGLGYYSRARNLHKAARAVVDSHQGAFPQSEAELRKLPGIGPYTAGAIASIAFNLPVPAVDGNVIRLLSRIYGISDDVTKPATLKKFQETAQSLIVPGQASDFTQALMEMGALVCTPTNPSCAQCPVQGECKAYGEGNPLIYPVKPKKAASRSEVWWAYVLVEGDRLLVRRRPEKGLLGGLWEFPWIPDEGEVEVSLAQAMEALGLSASFQDTLPVVTHGFTHFSVEVRPYRYLYGEGQLSDPAYRWVTVAELSQLPCTKIALRILSNLGSLMLPGFMVK